MNVLIYDNSPDDIKKINRICKQFELNVIETGDYEHARKTAEEGHIDIAVVNYSLKKITFNKEAKVIVTGLANSSAIIQMVRYNPVGFISKPVSHADISLAIAKACNTYCKNITFISNLVNISTVLKELDHKIASLLKDETNLISFQKSVDLFCKGVCAFSTPESRIPKGELSSYEILTLFSPKGVLFCKYKKGCLLWEFLRFIEGEFPSFFDKTPAEFITKKIGQDSIASFADIVKQINREHDKYLQDITDIRIKYCSSVCIHKKNDINFNKDDNIFSEYSEVLNGNCKYCTEKSCVIDSFFWCFKNKRD